MNIIIKTLTLLLLSLINVLSWGQEHKCGTMEHLRRSFAKDSTLRNRMANNEKSIRHWTTNNPRSKQGNGEVITIPTVVHVVWHDPIENISDEQIFSQIDVLNHDYRLLNSDSLDESHPFWPYSVDSEIEFCLAKQDPEGNATNGITRTQTDIATWDINNYEGIKSTANGGIDNWDPTRYLNIWVINSDIGVLGFATFPEELELYPEEDGVAIVHTAFGTVGTAGTGITGPFNLGRTTTHEVGHWLNLRHIWGDETCGDDQVDDTPTAEEPNYECPSFPHNPNNLCGSDSNGEMYMNYMDYTYDNCLNMFTIGQANRMHATLNGLRSGLLTSNGCELPTTVNDISNIDSAVAYPNPSNGKFTLTIPTYNNLPLQVTIINSLGELVKDFGNISARSIDFDVSDISNGIYYVTLKNSSSSISKKISIVK